MDVYKNLCDQEKIDKIYKEGGPQCNSHARLNSIHPPIKAMAGKKGAVVSKASAKKAVEVLEELEEDEVMLAPPPVAVNKAAIVEDEEDDGIESDDSSASKQRVVNSCVSMEFVKVVKGALPDDIKVDLTRTDLKLICETFVKTIISQVMSGEKVTLTNHMTFKRTLRKERKHVNPQKYNTKNTDADFEMITKPAHYILSMDVKPALKKVFEAIEIAEDEEHEEEVEVEVEEEIKVVKKGKGKKN